MAYKVQIPERQTFTLDRTDSVFGTPDSQPTRVTIRQATVRQNQERARLFAEWTREVSIDGVERTILRMPLYDQTVKETFLTLVGAENLIGPNDKPLFRFRNTPSGQILDMDFNTFQEAWGLLPDLVVNEIHEKVLIVNPHWSYKAEDPDMGEE